LISADIALHDVVVGLPGVARKSLRVGVEQRKNGWTVHGCEGRLSKKAPFSGVLSRPCLFGANTRPLGTPPSHRGTRNTHRGYNMRTCLQFAIKQRYPYYAKKGKGTINRHTSLSCQCRDDILLYCMSEDASPCQTAVYSKSGKWMPCTSSAGMPYCAAASPSSYCSKL
jgi:hypothetical protein